MTRYRVWIEHDRGTDCHLITADDPQTASSRALAHTEAPNARVVRIDGTTP